MPSSSGKTAQLIRGLDELKFRRAIFQLFLAGLAVMLAASVSCDSDKAPTTSNPAASVMLEVPDVQTIIVQAVEQAERLNEKVVVAVTDREANVLGVFSMTGAPSRPLPLGDDPVTGAIFGAIGKARTASYLSSNQHGFTTVTACFITRSHFPPGINNTAGGPLYGVPFSSLGGGDIQPNGDAGNLVLGPGAPGLTGVPGGVPIFKNGLLAGGLGVSGGQITQQMLDDLLCCCSGVFTDEIIALAGTRGFSAPDNKRGDLIFLDGIRLLFQNAETPTGNFTLSFSDLATRGAVDTRFSIPAIRTSPPPKFPELQEGELFREVNLGIVNGVNYDFTIKRDGRSLTTADVRRIINQAAVQAAKTRAAIRRPIGSPARVFISVVDVDGSVLGIGRTPDATLFSYDVSAQKARTALAFSDPNHPLGMMVRNILGLTNNAGLAMSSRAVGFLSQRFYPPGIDEETLGRTVEPGPLFVETTLPLRFFDFEFQRTLVLASPIRNGITIFPGGVPLYKDGELAGGIGISGDGVDQDDIICFAGSIGFEPPEEFRCDRFSYRGAKLPYVKFPRQPELD